MSSLIELDTDNVSLGAVSTKVDGAGPRLGNDVEVHPTTLWCMAPVLVCPGTLPWAM
jgi:hypothetical protein